MATSSRPRLFFPLLVVQLILGAVVVIGLLQLGFWKTAIMEICKLAVVLPEAFRLRRAVLAEHAVPGDASPPIAAGTALLVVSAFSEAILISYDVQLGHHSA